MLKEWLVDVVGGTAGPAPDLDEVRRALAVLVDPAGMTEILSLFPARHPALPGTDLDGLVDEIRRNSGSSGTFVAVNLLPPDFSPRSGLGARVADFSRRRHFVIDVDPLRPSKLHNATQAEHAEALRVVEAVLAYLKELAWPDPMVIDTGNGYHVLFRTDLPNDEPTRSVMGRALKQLARRFDTPAASIDRGSNKATFHARLPGTWNRKGPHSPERPHRMVRFHVLPDTIDVLSLEQIEALAGREVAPPPKEKVWPVPVVDLGGNRVAAYTATALEAECRAVATCTDHRNDCLNTAALKLGQLVGAGLLEREEVERRLEEAACACGLDSDTGGLRGVRATIKSGLEAGMAKPRGMPQETGPAPSTNGYPKGNKPPPKWAPGEQLFVRASEVMPEEVDFLWPDRIPLGMLTTFAGVTSLGKTFVLCDIAARVSRGLDWPDSDGECSKPGQVLFISGEDSLKHTIVPRLIEANADRDKIVFLTTEVQERFTLADLDILEEALKQAGGDFRLVAIDPPTAFIPDTVDDNKNAQLRGLLSPLKTWAEKYRLALIFITHFNKRSGEGVDALARVMGSVAWVNAVRAAHMFAKDTEDSEGQRRLFLPLKMNICASPQGLSYRIVKKGSLASVEWLGAVDTTADEAHHTTKKKTRGENASEWLIECFREKREWDSDTLFETARQNGISRDAIYEAKRQLDLPKAKRYVAPDGSVTWRWWVPDNWPPLGLQGQEYEV